jgi:hypothetical protein
VNYKYLEYAQMSDKKNTAAMLDKKTDAWEKFRNLLNAQQASV